MFDFQSLPLFLNILIFLLSAGATWLAGSRIALYADAIADRFHLGQAFAGLILLALATQLPEVATTVTAAAYGNASLAVSNLFGSVLTNAVLIAVVDFLFMRNALTFFTPKPVVALQGMFVIILLALTLSGMIVGEVLVVFQVGLWSFVLFVLYILGVYLSNRYEKSEGEQWQAVSTPGEEEQAREQAGREGSREKAQQMRETTPTNRLVLFFGVGALLILAAGFFLARTGDVIAQQTGLGASFFGAVVLALATSLPELSTSASAVKVGNYSMAVSNLFGSNAVLFALIFIDDIAYRDGPILHSLTAPAMFSLTMGIVVMTVFLVGMVERRNTVVLKMGLDSLAVVVLYLLSLVGLFYLSR